MKQPFPIERFGIIQLKFINGCLGFQENVISEMGRFQALMSIFRHQAREEQLRGIGETLQAVGSQLRSGKRANIDQRNVIKM